MKNDPIHLESDEEKCRFAIFLMDVFNMEDNGGISLRLFFSKVLWE
jgi:hypothetical protein